MHNLSSFLAYKSNCPFCSLPLEISLYVGLYNLKALNIVLDETFLSFTLPFSGWQMSKKSFTYYIDYLINLETNELDFQFFNNKYEKMNLVSTKLLQDYQSYYEKKRINFLRYCPCFQYCYHSPEFSLIAPIENIIVQSETYSFISPNQYQLYLINYSHSSYLYSAQPFKLKCPIQSPMQINHQSIIKMPILSGNPSQMKKELDILSLFS